ncbi:RDD family protein [Desulfogranum japonicum]|uniref:RDD family protein n=1 Tax=Desulfogranum japonicum TaxID=231447 RepID=UPI000408DB4E|nr:RDD family protein [Desulfogranum japonicum]
MVSPTHSTDTLYFYQTPEGVELELVLAGPVVRACAWGIDLLIRVGAYILAGVVLGFFGGVGRGMWFIGIFLIEWFYPVIFEAVQGATPGKKVMGLQVVMENGTPVGWTGALIRNLMRCVDFLPLCNFFGVICIVASSRFQRLGDLAAGTLVMYRQKEQASFVIPERSSKPTPLPLRVDEQRLILNFCERSGQLSRARTVELARLLPELLQTSKPVDELYSYGNWFTRGRAGR